MILRAEPPASGLRGELRAPGDKSISHRALILAGLAEGESELSGLLDSADTRATRAAMAQLGAAFREHGDDLRVQGLGSEGLQPPAQPLDMGNSGTAMRLLAGVLAAQDFDSELSGDASLNRRPMRRIIAPLESMGARIQAQADGTAPLRIQGGVALRGIDYASPVASAQVKSCVLLAGLYASGTTRVREPRASRDHTERMLPLFGVPVQAVSVAGGARLRAAALAVPADPSSAAFAAAAAALVPGSDVLLTDVGLNPTRCRFYDVLGAMGARVEVTPRGPQQWEPRGDIRVRHGGRLKAVDLPLDWIPALIDEVPVILALAATAHGVTRIRGAGELRVKESDRLAVMAAGLGRAGVVVREYDDGLDVEGGAVRGARLEAADDHRCAMSFAVLGQVSDGAVVVSGAANIDTSYPGFTRDLTRLGARVSRAGDPAHA